MPNSPSIIEDIQFIAVMIPIKTMFNITFMFLQGSSVSSLHDCAKGI